MRLRTFTSIVACSVPLLAAGCSGCVATYRDVGPDFDDARNEDWRGSSAGLIYQLAGDRNTLYAVSLNAGIWRRKSGERWHQLSQSSPLTTSLAVDPTNPRHLVSGDRNNAGTDSDPANYDLSLSGLWESTDAGDTWQLVYSPLTRVADASAPAYCVNIQSQSIAAVVVTPVGTVLAGTPCGIARRATGASTYDFPPIPAGLAAITAFAVARISSVPAASGAARGSRPTTSNLIWALARNVPGTVLTLLWSDTDGSTWNAVALQSPVNGYGVPQATGEEMARGDDFSLAAFGDSVAMVFKPTPDQENKTGIVYYNRSTRTFSAHLVEAGNDGTGWGGRRSIRAIPIHSPYSIGDGVRIVLNTAQGVFDGEGINRSGMVKWRKQITAHCRDCQDPDPMHADIWDVLPASDNDDLWVATDGGIYAKSDTLGSFNAGLFTQHIHTLSLIEAPLGLGGPRLDYATSDNDAWFSPGPMPGSPAAVWRSYTVLGDANWTAADRGNSRISLEVRDGLSADITDFGDGPPNGSSHVGGDNFLLSCRQTAGNPGACSDADVLPRNFRVVQTGSRSLPYRTGGLLDVVWLTSLPLQYKNGDTVTNLSSGVLSDQVKTASSPVLLRNSALAVQPDINTSQFKGWSLESGSVPTSASRVWVSVENGHHPWEAVYYVCVCDHVATAHLFKQKTRSAPWEPVVVKIDQPSGSVITRDILPAWEDAKKTVRGTTGPVWVDPINPNRLVVLTTVGVVISNDGGASWTEDRTLTLLLTNSWQYPFATGYPAGSDLGVVLGTRGLRFMYASDVAFGWGDDQLAVASPFTGVYVRGGVNQPWLDLTQALPRPLATVSSLAFWGRELYVATEGRSLVQTIHSYDARMGAVFDRTVSPRTGARTIRLLRSDGAAVANSRVSLTTITQNGVLQASALTSTAMGEVVLPSGLPVGTRIFLRYAGDSSAAPAETAFRT